MVAEFSGLMESSAFFVAEFQQGVSKTKEYGEVEIEKKWFNKDRK